MEMVRFHSLSQIYGFIFLLYGGLPELCLFLGVARFFIFLVISQLGQFLCGPCKEFD